MAILWLTERWHIHWWQVKRNVLQKLKSWKVYSRTPTTAAHKRNTTSHELFGRIPYCAEQPDYQPLASRIDDSWHCYWGRCGGWTNEFRAWRTNLCGRAVRRLG